jgi:hypothetical protein
LKSPNPSRGYWKGICFRRWTELATNIFLV